jgi:hypothetical protein
MGAGGTGIRRPTGGEGERRTEAERNTHERVRAWLTFVRELQLLGRRVHAALAPLWCQGGFQKLRLTLTEQVCAGGELGQRDGGLGTLRSHRSLDDEASCKGCSRRRANSSLSLN